jgi:outer membrane biosynthesis protein TonB
MVLAVPGPAPQERTERTERAEPTAETRPADSEPEGTPKPTPQPIPEPTPEPTPEATTTAGRVPSADTEPASDTGREPVEEEGTSPVVPLVAIGSLLAAGLLEGLAWRRSVQLQTRPKGRRIPAPPSATLDVAAALQRKQRP